MVRYLHSLQEGKNSTKTTDGKGGGSLFTLKHPQKGIHP